MGSAFHQLCPRYSGTLAPTAPTAIRLWDTFTFFISISAVCGPPPECNRLADHAEYVSIDFVFN